MLFVASLYANLDAGWDPLKVFSYSFLSWPFKLRQYNYTVPSYLLCPSVILQIPYEANLSNGGTSFQSLSLREFSKRRNRLSDWLFWVQSLPLPSTGSTAQLIAPTPPPLIIGILKFTLSVIILSCWHQNPYQSSWSDEDFWRRCSFTENTLQVPLSSGALWR